MKNKKGFTLIELLAVIVILAIIALIAVPVILNMIENARKSAAKSSAYGYIEAINNNNELAGLQNNDMDNIPNRIDDGTYEDVTEIDIKIKGKKPTSGTLTISNGRVSNATDLCFNDYKVSYTSPEITGVVKGCSGDSTPTSNFGGTLDKSKQYSSSNVEQLGLKGVAYLDPTDLTAECNSSSTLTNTNTGCKKFYIFDDSGNTYKMIMDRNTTGKVAYNTTTPYVTYENASIKRQVDEDTAGWAGSSRLITADEIVTITNNEIFDESSGKWFYFGGTGDNKQTQPSRKQGASSYAWLYDYTYGCASFGCNLADPSTKGYWTSSSVSDDSSRAWRVGNNGDLSSLSVDFVYAYGIRPVITINKSQLQ